MLPDGQTAPHTPQFCASIASVAQPLQQYVWPDGHTQADADVEPAGLDSPAGHGAQVDALVAPTALESVPAVLMAVAFAPQTPRAS